MAQYFLLRTSETTLKQNMVFTGIYHILGLFESHIASDTPIRIYTPHTVKQSSVTFSVLDIFEAGIWQAFLQLISMRNIYLIIIKLGNELDRGHCNNAWFPDDTFSVSDKSNLYKVSTKIDLVFLMNHHQPSKLLIISLFFNNPSSYSKKPL